MYDSCTFLYMCYKILYLGLGKDEIWLAQGTVELLFTVT